MASAPDSVVPRLTTWLRPQRNEDPIKVCRIPFRAAEGTANTGSPSDGGAAEGGGLPDKQVTKPHNLRPHHPTSLGSLPALAKAG
jgi:hypothetical protein